VNLKQSKYKDDFGVIDTSCDCRACRRGDTAAADGGYTKAYLHSIVAKETVAATLVTQHNLRWLHLLMAELRLSIRENRFHAFVVDFLATHFPGDVPKRCVPTWAVDALAAAGVTLPPDVVAAAVAADKAANEAAAAKEAATAAKAAAVAAAKTTAAAVVESSDAPTADGASNSN
jgi:hypothetical protein